MTLMNSFARLMKQKWVVNIKRQYLQTGKCLSEISLCLHNWFENSCFRLMFFVFLCGKLKYVSRG